MIRALALLGLALVAVGAVKGTGATLHRELGELRQRASHGRRLGRAGRDAHGAGRRLRHHRDDADAHAAPPASRPATRRR